MSIKELKHGDYFTIKPIEEPKENQVWVRGHYDRVSKTFSALNYADMNKERFFKSDKEVFTDFTF